ncbi:MAG TPA: hypothetical protein VGV35_08420, partial [Bryobacteraceae bacterium]|nr:hypothetical protein [Bryobacteraceae bacterium]
SVTVLAIIGIIWAILSMLCGGYSLASSFLTLSSGRNLFGPGTLTLPHWIMMISIVSGASTMVLAVVLLISCIGAMYLRKWAHGLVMAWAIITLLFTTVSTVLQITWLGPETLAAMKQSQPNNPAFAQAQGIMQWSMIGGAIVAWLFTCVLPICFLTLWNKPLVKEAFEGQVP